MLLIKQLFIGFSKIIYITFKILIDFEQKTRVFIHFSTPIFKKFYE